MEVDFLLVGHGIAGVCIAEQLDKNKLSYTVIDRNTEQTSSKVAAGLYNPITGRKMKKTWLAGELFPYLEEFYQYLENKLSEKFFHERDIYRPFLSLEDQNDWVGNSSDSDHFIKATYTKANFSEYIHDEFGGLLLAHAGFVDLNSLIKAHKTYLLSKHKYIEEEFFYDQLKVNEGNIIYNDIIAKRIVFCDGPLSENPFFSWIPTAPVKGEILHIETEKPLVDNVIFNRGVFIVKSQHHSYYRVGSTYEWKDLDWKTTDKARGQLIQKLDDLLKVPYKIVGQEAGIRPATKDRRPLLGNHPQHSHVYLFNGLGTKGVSLAPYFSEQLISSIISDTKIITEANINRYYSLY